ncbi:MAG TPA: PilN domain-containing protein [Burkholderiales bacterium]|nr:PilN domain-containing protein [Burkholderiales bacterium]
MSQQINLCNPLFRKQKKYFSALTMFQALGLILFGILLFYGYLAYQTRALATQYLQMIQLQDNTKRQLDALASRVGNRKPDQALSDRVAQMEQTLHAELSVLNMLQRGELGNQTGFSPYFVALSRQAVNGLWLTGFNISGMADEIGIDGRALQPELVAKLIRQLKNEPVFAGVHFTKLEIRRPALADKDVKTGDNKVVVSATANVTPYVEFALVKNSAGPVK